MRKLCSSFGFLLPFALHRVLTFRLVFAFTWHITKWIQSSPCLKVDRTKVVCPPSQQLHLLAPAWWMDPANCRRKVRIFSILMDWYLHVATYGLAAMPPSPFLSGSRVSADIDVWLFIQAHSMRCVVHFCNASLTCTWIIKSNKTCMRRNEATNDESQKISRQEIQGANETQVDWTDGRRSRSHHDGKQYKATKECGETRIYIHRV
jgi:hypothetical protein